MNNLFKKITADKREFILFSLMLFFVLSFPITFNLNSISIISLGIFFFFDSKENIKRKFLNIKNIKIVQIMVAYFLFFLIGLLNSKDLRSGSQVVTRLLPFLFLPTIILAERLSIKNINLLLDISKIWIVLIFIYFTGYQYLIENREISTTVHFTYKKIGISHHYISILIVVLIMDALKKIFDKKNRWFNSVLLIFMLFFLLLLSSRTNLLILVLSLVMFFLDFLKKAKLRVKILMFLGSLFLTFLAFFSSPELESKTKRFIKTTDFDIEIIKTKNSVTFAKNTIEHRILINLASFNIIKTSPIFGIGTGSSVSALNTQYKKMNFIAAIKQKFNAHNQYLENFIELGIMGFICIVLLMIITIKESLKNKSLMLYSTIGIAFLCFFESFFARHHGVSFFAFFIPLFYKIEIYKNE